MLATTPLTPPLIPPPKLIGQMLSLCIGLFIICHNSHSLVEEGIHFDESINANNSQALQLNGVGTRTVWGFKIYVAGLYLPRNSADVETILSMTGPKRVRMVFLHKKVSAKKLAKTFDKGFKANHSAEALDQFSAQLEQLKSLFKTVRRGDEVVLDYIPGVGTHLYGNQELLGVIPGFEFNQALLNVWLGQKPADKSLKKRFLGQ